MQQCLRDRWWWGCPPPGIRSPDSAVIARSHAWHVKLEAWTESADLYNEVCLPHSSLLLSQAVLNVRQLTQCVRYDSFLMLSTLHYVFHVWNCKKEKLTSPVALLQTIFVPVLRHKPSPWFSMDTIVRLQSSSLPELSFPSRKSSHNSGLSLRLYWTSVYCYVNLHVTGILHRLGSRHNICAAAMTSLGPWSSGLNHFRH